MASRIVRAVKQNLIKPPPFVNGGIQYEVITGSFAYGCNTDTSDEDIYGFCMPPKEMVFPHITGYIRGFGKKPQGFDQYQQHHVMDTDAGKEYDFSIYNIIKFFHLTMECSPNMIDSLFVPEKCVLNSTKIGSMLRDNRKLFLSKKCWHTFKGYAFQQLKKMKNKKPEGKRLALVEKYGFDTKFASHVVRCMLQCEQMLEECDLDLQRNSRVLRHIRTGQWTKEYIEEWFNTKSLSVEPLYNSSKLPWEPRYVEIRQLLMNCLEEYYGSLQNLVVKQGDCNKMAQEIKDVIGRYT